MAYSIARLRKMHGPLWIMIYCIAVCITLVPAHLLEPRYFTPGIVIAILNSPPICSPTCTAKTYRYAAVYLTVAAFAAVNVVAMYVFIYRPFVWPDGSVARFMY
jgi:alpha-1,2-glucosyltransferase